MLSHDQPTSRGTVGSQVSAPPPPSVEDRIRAAYAKRPKGDARYSCFNPAYLFAVQERERRVIAMLKHDGCMPIDGRTILEVGCGAGFWLREFIKWGARPENVSGVELLADRVAEARRLCPQGVTVECANAVDLPFNDGAFDIVLQATAFTSVPDSWMRQRMAAEMLRVARPEGLILWYDFRINNPRNPDVHGIGKREIRELFPACRITLHRVTLAPPLARWLVPRSWLASHVLATLPFFCTHYLGVVRKREEVQ